MELAALVLAISASIAPAVDLRWNAPEGCPDAASVTARLGEYLGHAAASGEPARVDADVRRLDDGAWELTLRFEDRPEDPRVLTNATCEGLAEAAVVVVAIVVTPEVAEPSEPVEPVEPSEPAVPAPSEPASEPPTPAPAPASEPAPVSTEAEPVADREPARPARPVELSVSALAGVGFGPVPVGFALAPSLAVSGPRWRVALSAIYEPTRSLRLADLPESGSDLMHWALGPEACWLPRVLPRLAIPVCGGVELGRLEATPVALVDGRPRRSSWAAATVAVGLRARVHPRVALWLAPSAVITLTPARVRVEGEPEPLFRTAPVGVRGLAGLEVIVW
jgi:hypothetical protein